MRSFTLGDEAEKLITMCKTKVIQESLAGFPTEEWTHSANSFSSFHRQSISAALNNYVYCYCFDHESTRNEFEEIESPPCATGIDGIVDS